MLYYLIEMKGNLEKHPSAENAEFGVKTISRCWRDDSAIKTGYCFSQRSEFGSQYPYQADIQLQGNPMALVASGTCAKLCAHMHVHSQRG